MVRNIFSQLLIIMVAIVLVVPAGLYVAPQKAEAAWPTFDGANVVQTTITAIKSTLNLVQSTLIQINTYAQWVNTYILQPIAFIQSIKSMKSLTAGVIAFVTGQSNGNGSPQFVQNLQANLQRVGDSQALAFFAQFGKTSNSPFAASIASSLRSNYLQNTSLAGFWAASKCTLTVSSPNINNFLAGNWSKGGAAAWLSLTTQTQNNPFTLYQSAQSKLGTLVTGAQEARKQVLSFGQGFMSWCGTTDSNTGYVSPGDADQDAANATVAANTTQSPGDADQQLANQQIAAARGVNPGDPCTQSDGTPGVVKTPGSTIKSTLDKVLGGSQDKLAQIGNIGTQAGSIVSLIGSIMNTVAFAQQVLGGGQSGGLASLGATVNPPTTSTAPNPITTATQQVVQSAINSPASGASTMSSRIAEYKSLWVTITGAANAAKGSLTDLANVCTTNGNNSIAGQAQTAITNQINPILAQAQTANADVAAAEALLAKSSSGELTPEDIQTLGSMRPTASDVATLQEEVKHYSQGMVPTANPNGSLNVSGGTTIDRLALLALNAAQMKSVCVFDAGGTTSGGGQ